MTEEQAIEVLEKEKAYMLAHGGDSQFTALDMAIKALEQQPSDDEITITMKKGTLKYSGHGYVAYKKDWFRKHFATEVAIMTGYEGYIEKPSEDCISRQAVIEYIEACGAELGHDIENESVREDILNMPPVTPTHGTCKDCKHWKDSDGVYRRGIGAESKCPINNSRVFEGTFYCADFEKRGDENVSS